MVLEKLSSGIQNAVKGLRKSVIVDKKTVKTYIKEIQRVLLAGDVSVDLVFKLSRNIEERGLLEKPPGSLTRKENLIKITYDELVSLLGTGSKLKPGKGSRILLVGIQGSGKTTTAAKLAKYYQKKGTKVALICADTFRPAAYDQLKQLSEEINIPFYGEEKSRESLGIIKNGLNEFRDKDIVIIDSEGRNKLDKELMHEIKRTYDTVKPEETLLVLDATIGQQAGGHAKAFKESCGVTGVILTKLDGTAKGGGAISACAATYAPVCFVGTGEHIDDFEKFNSERFVSRLIGFGDLEGLLEKAKEVEMDEEMAKRFMAGKFTLDDVYYQIQEIDKMGSMKKILEMLPSGLGSRIPKEMMRTQEGQLRKFRVVMDSMTREEKENPTIIKKSRVSRIAKGSGTETRDVKELLRYYKKMKRLMKSMGDERRMGRLLKGLGM